MKKEEIFDINGKNPKVGDKIAYASGWTTNNAYLDICTIDKIIEHNKTVDVHLNIERTGLWGQMEDFKGNRNFVIRFPMSHCKFMIIS